MRCLTAGFLVMIGLSGASKSLTAQKPSPIEIVRGLGLDSADVGSIRVRFVPSDRAYALQLAALCDEVVSHFKREFGSSFSPQLAVLRPEHWFVPYAGGEGEPYGIPWG